MAPFHAIRKVFAPTQDESSSNPGVSTVMQFTYCPFRYAARQPIAPNHHVFLPPTTPESKTTLLKESMTWSFTPGLLLLSV